MFPVLLSEENGNQLGKKKIKMPKLAGNCFIFRCNAGYLVREVLRKIFFLVFVPCPLIINSSYWWSRNVNKNKTLVRLSCQLSNFLEWIETSFWLRRAPDAACHVSILSVNKSATQSLTSRLWWGMCMLKNRLEICCPGQAWIYRDLVAVRKRE